MNDIVVGWVRRAIGLVETHVTEADPAFGLWSVSEERGQRGVVSSYGCASVRAREPPHTARKFLI
jgi:hypothetical protein